MPLQVFSGFCGSRYFAGRLRRTPAEAPAPSSGKMSRHLVAFGCQAAFELGPQLLAVLLLPRRHLGVGLREQLGELVDVERFEVDGCHFGLRMVV